ncbi:hypothetical protein Pmar_PMAR012341 [Perkinsus marinus ATCC 50983]|uniref:Uncharacterized protein n=1 Tax=Perkinsus marinus (strain ATCC 50983 / TXsc) TaxID=423536 RepID=C5K730_PERM5|nr:hypothetical protein Pmar_PMAR012341 [Perkinsus marinus ATCC 50983]EER19365.1 hypothetical protein Pmar_PMAR012341 [Perkinsus marinus ATCC 50983]|eukprot:XP_002787569.1 hypothetical protein Pmar_PMAR012341 [Perkinsus marinus ATCC 50983]
MPRSASSPSSPSGGGEGGFSVVLRSYLNGLTTLKRTGSGNKFEELLRALPSDARKAIEELVERRVEGMEGEGGRKRKAESYYQGEGGDGSEAPKRKRGRPRKVSTQQDNKAAVATSTSSPSEPSTTTTTMEMSSSGVDKAAAEKKYSDVHSLLREALRGSDRGGEVAVVDDIFNTVQHSPFDFYKYCECSDKWRQLSADEQRK